MCSSKFLLITTSRSAWTEKTGLWTTSELSVFGEASSTRTSKRYETMKDLKAGINAYFNFYNTVRFHQSLDYNVPDEMYKCFQYNELERKKAA